MTNEEFAIRIKSGEHGLMGELWEQNTGIFKLKAFRLYDQYRDRCASSGVELDDIVQISYFALCDAVTAFPIDGEYKLLSYIKYPLLNRFHSLVGIRSSKRDPLDQCGSLNETIGDDENAERIDFLADPNSDAPFEAALDNLFQSELHDALETEISKLPDNRAAAIRGRYFENKSQGEIAAEMRVSNTYVQHLEREGLRKLRRVTYLQAFHDELLAELAYKHRGLKTFRETGESSVEIAVIRAEYLTDQKRVALRKGFNEQRRQKRTR
jgi:RNA polymerase sigma factor (sigma-70 family)